jgi:spore maturation protein B
MGNSVISIVILLIFIVAIFKKVDIFSAFSEGVKEGISSAIGIFTPLLALITGVSILKASGFFDALSFALNPLLSFIGLPKELLPLILIKPFSGSGTTVILKNLFESFGADSFVGKAASIISAATETTFYAVSVYFGAVGIKKSAHTIPCALIGDFSVIVLSLFAAHLF